jgi:hypothetical protein
MICVLPALPGRSWLSKALQGLAKICSVVRFEPVHKLLIVPKFSVPVSVVTGEMAFYADRAVTGVRDRAERQ